MIGIFSKTTDSNLIESLGYSGMDFVIIDQEHGPSTNETLHNHIRAAKVSNIRSIVRVKGLDANAIGSALDAGADGVQIPNISTSSEARKAIQAAKFFPNGNRGVCRFVKAANFGTLDKQEYFVGSNKTLLILQVEGKEGINNLDDILKIEGFDILFVGPYDLSQSLGIPGEIDHPEMIEMMKKVSEKAQSQGKRLGTFADSIKTAKFLLGLGFEYLAYSVDMNIFAEANRQIKIELNKS